MKPNDQNGLRPTAERPFRVLVISGSGRRQYNCPGVDSKSRTLMLRMSDRLPADWEIDFEDLGNVYGRARIQSCNACVRPRWHCAAGRATATSPTTKAIIGPVNWYAPSSNLKLMFDRLVCMNGGNPREHLIEHKNAELASTLEHSDQWEALSVNHLEGRTAGFFCYGDGGGDELDKDGRPTVLRRPGYFNPDDEPFDDNRDSYAPLVWQCRYGGVEVPDDLWRYVEFGQNRKYSDNQAEHMQSEPHVLQAFDDWTNRFARFVAAKGKVTPGQYRAYGYKAPGHKWEDLKLLWRDASMRVGLAPPGSSPRAQHHLGLNRDDTLTPKTSEGERLRKG